MNQTSDKDCELTAQLAEQTLRILAHSALKADGAGDTEASERVRKLFKALRPTLAAPSSETGTQTYKAGLLRAAEICVRVGEFKLVPDGAAAFDCAEAIRAEAAREST